MRIGRTVGAIAAVVLTYSAVVGDASASTTETWRFGGFAVGRTAGNEPVSTDGTFMAEGMQTGGAYRIYYGALLASPGSLATAIRYATSTDGASWTVGGSVLTGASDQDDPEYTISGPSIVRLPDGRYRMYYQSSPNSPPGQSPKYHVRSAISSDGLAFTREPGARINSTAFDASAAMRLAGHGTYYRARNGTYVGIFSGELASDPLGPSDLKMAISKDGLAFGSFTTLFKDWHDPIVIPVDGGFRMYATYLLEKQGTAFSEDGLTWPSTMTDVRFIDQSGKALTEDNSGVGDIGGFRRGATSIRLVTNWDSTIGPVTTSRDIVYFDRVAGTGTRHLRVDRSGKGSGSATSVPAGITCGSTCSDDLADGASVTLTAVARAGSRFTGWSGACSGIAACRLRMTEDTAVTATFKRLCRVPNVVGLRLAAAKRAVRRARCRVGRVVKADSNRPSGVVAAQRPRAGRALLEGGRVNLTVSR